jgi:hypothetical protein
MSGIASFSDSCRSLLATGRRRVQNPCPKSTSHNQPCQGFCDAPRMGHLLGYASACHHRPAAPAPGRRPPARRLTGRSPRPPAAPGATAPPTASLSTSSAPATPWSSGDWSASAAPCGIWSTPSPAWPSAASASAASRRRPRHHPRRQVRLLCLCGPGRVRTRPHPRTNGCGAGCRQGPRPPRRPAVGADRGEGPVAVLAGL